MKHASTFFSVIVLMTVTVLSYSCKKEVKEVPETRSVREFAANSGEVSSGANPYLFERINEHNFQAQGWREQQIDLVAGTTSFLDESVHMEIVCGPANISDPRLIQGAVTMNLPTSANPALRRIRIRKEGYSGTKLADLDELKYSTFVVQKAPSVLVLQVDLDNDGDIDHNFFYDPVPAQQGPGATPVVYNTWQQWDALAGKWEIFNSTIPEFPQNKFTLAQLSSYPQYANARILDTIPYMHKGEGIRFTIGGGPDYNNTIGYLDAFIIKTKQQQVARFYDFTCSNPFLQ